MILSRTTHLSSRPDWHWWMPTTTTTTVRGHSNPRYVLKADNTSLGVRTGSAWGEMLKRSIKYKCSVFFVLFFSLLCSLCSLYHARRYSWVLFFTSKTVLHPHCFFLYLTWLWPYPIVFIFFWPSPSLISMQISRSVDFTRGGATVSVYYLGFSVPTL